MHRFFKMAALLLLVPTLYGCGGSGGNWQLESQSFTNDSYLFPSGGTAVISFSAAGTTNLPVPISAIDMTVTLPQGINVTTVSGTSGQLDTTTVVPGSALGGTNLAYGSYTDATRTLQLSMATTSGSYRSGEFLRLYVKVPAGVNVTLGDLRASNSKGVLVKAIGYDPVTQNTVILTSNVVVTINAVQLQ